MSDLPDSATDLIGEGSVHPSQYDESEYNWLLNLDVDHSTAQYIPATPVSVHSTVPSTPALPKEVSGSDHTTTPARFSPEPQDVDQLEAIEDDQATISERTYDDISEFFYLYFFYSSDFYLVRYLYTQSIYWN